MSPRAKVRVRRALVLALILLAGAFALPRLLSADRFGKRVGEALERALARPVEIRGKVRFNLLTGPGFSLTDVVIHEDPRFGIEPLAYVAELDARLRFAALLLGRFEFSTLRLLEPSVNLMKTDAGSWNIQPLVERALGAPVPASQGFPAIEIQAGRFNFKFGDRKSAFYFTNADADIAPSSGRDAFEVRLTAEAARADRAAQGFGRFSIRGRYRPRVGAESEIDGVLELERSAIAEISRLIEGRDIGLHGLISSRAQLAGPLSRIEIRGSLRVEDVHRWDLMPPKGDGWPLNYTGLLDLREQRLELDASRRENPDLPFEVRFRANALLSAARWAGVITAHEVQVVSLVEVASHMGATLPPELAAAGKLTGAVGYSSAGEIQGSLMVADASLRLPEAPPVSFRRADVLLDRGRVQLLPADVESATGQVARVQADYVTATRALDLRIRADRLSLAELQSGPGRLVGTHLLPLVRACRGGAWRGALAYRRAGESPGEWTGNFEVRNTLIDVPGIADPLEISAASATLEGERLQIRALRGRAGDAQIEGEYRFEPRAPRPHRFRLVLAEIDAVEVERLMLPTLSRGGGFLRRTLRLAPAPVPEWLRSRHAEGTVEIGSLQLGETSLDSLSARVLWDGVEIELSRIAAQLEGAAASGQVTVALAGAAPAYRVHGQLSGWSWRSGKLDVTGDLESSGTGAELLANLRVDGSFSARAIALPPGGEFRTASGSFEFRAARGAPRLRVAALQLAAGPDLFSGDGGTQADGRLQLDLSSGRKQMRITGSLAPLQLEIAK